MKRKILILILIMILSLMFTSCKGVPCGEPEWMRAENEVYHYWQAIINRQYKLAKYYCITDGIWYNKTDEWEEYINTNSQGETSIMISEPHFQKQTEVIGNNATAYIDVFIDKITFLNNHLIDEGKTFEYEIELIRQDHPPGDWELK